MLERTFARNDPFSHLRSQILGECSALWASVSEALCMVGVYVSSHRKLHRMLSQSSASSLHCWSCTHWLKCVASVISDVPLMGSHIEGGELGFN